MEVTEITQLILNLGFPIVACIALFKRMGDQDRQHKEEMDKITEALNNNTVAITRLAERMGGDRDEQ